MQCERFCIIPVLVPVPVSVLDQTSVNTPLQPGARSNRTRCKQDPVYLYEKSLFSRGIVHSYFYLENDVTKRSKTTNITPVCTERQSQRCNNSAMRLVILLYLITMELLQNRIGTHFQATPLFSMRAVSLASQSCGRVDSDTWRL